MGIGNRLGGGGDASGGPDAPPSLASKGFAWASLPGAQLGLGLAWLGAPSGSDGRGGAGAGRGEGRGGAGGARTVMWSLRFQSEATM